ncbi:MAG: single-stranded-DNA-specific exonuclease RecJ [Patescibacteria group bacterium]
MQLSVKKNIWVSKNKKGLPLINFSSTHNFSEIREKISENFENLPVPNLEKIADKILNFDHCIIHGDYDVDGICSSAIIFKTLKKVGISAEIILPNRFGGGYGINLEETLKKFSERKSQIKNNNAKNLLITLDCGTNEDEKFLEISKVCKNFIVIDHHEPDNKNFSGKSFESFPIEEKPEIIICNPKIKNSFLETENLVTSGLALKLALIILKKCEIYDAKFFDEIFALSATGTTCDVAPMKYENWQIVRRGLKNFRGKNFGLDALIEVSEIDKNEKTSVKNNYGYSILQQKITNYHLGFVLGPRINATGRMNSPEKSLEILLSENFKSARNLAKFLNNENEKRQEDTENAVKKILEDFEIRENQKFIFFGDKTFSRGIVGIVASKMMEKKNLPAFIFEEGEDFCIGSARSAGQIDLAEILQKIGDSLISGGGHKKAGGFVFRTENKQKVFERLTEEIEKTFVNLPKTLAIDSEIAELNEKNLMRFVESFENFEPFGFENSEPIFMIRNAKILSFSKVGKEKNHLRIKFSTKNENEFFGIFFNFPENLKIKKTMDFAISFKISEFNNKRKIDFIVEDLR